MNTTEEILKERIKELTCLYEVSSIIVNTDANQIPETFNAITQSLQRGFQYPDHTEIAITTPVHSIATGTIANKEQLTASIRVFNNDSGSIIAALPSTEYAFLKEEQQLLDSVALKIGNLLERVEIQQNELQLRRQMQRADRLAILGEITAGIAHELNTPLANILGFAELHKADLEEKGLEHSDVNKIIQNAIFAREVVKNLMFFTCAMPQEMQQINMVPQLKSALELLDSTFKKKGVRYETKIAKDEISIKADTIQFTQIVFNLIMNAIYFSPTGGKVTIEANETETHAVIKVIDEGSGLSDEALDKVFEPFFTTKPTGDGTGLGLSVVHGIVASHKGSITAANHTNGGAIFTVKIPK
ncbi:His Kinase A (phospho-acceptor) domain-containing protein [Pustulibacterium marinum]|uniref:histidine kinase n=1 Tax=Pustulibacterium marinum TaxID=1224947 RepID=A0A1I7IQH7_9FLAO|nr:HAMP domain-containing sensor histidine kinase [Pustulibacterium marinum]SFU75183.1 His Kinase A (phospho-acceptor) domain-containing protein [Pustulibacterium marinum]